METRYRALRLIAVLYKIFGVVIIAIGLLMALGVLLVGFLGGGLGGLAAGAADVAGGAMLVSVVSALMTFVLSFLAGLALYGGGELLNLLIDVEENTRRTADLLEHPPHPSFPRQAPAPAAQPVQYGQRN
jgi:hypothetical protein